MEREKTKGELIAEKLEKEADEMLKHIEDSQTESEPEAKGLATEEAEVEDTPEEVVEDAETLPDESQETEEASDQQEEEIQEEDDKSDKGLLSAEQWEERYKNAQARMTKATQREKELEAKIAEMSNKITAIESMKSEARIEKQKEEVNIDLGEIMKDYPEIVKPLQSYVDARIASVDQKMQQATQEVLKSQQEEADRKHYAAIAEEHPDWKSVSTSDDFTIWLERQSRMWRTAASDGDAQDVIALLSKYKNDLGLVSKKVSKEELVEKAKQNVEPSLSKARKQNVGSSKKIWTAQEIGKLSDKDFRKLEKEIDQAYADGRVRP
jgi:DNA repair exonuclease SbcCD ATPase subunit